MRLTDTLHEEIQNLDIKKYVADCYLPVHESIVHGDHTFYSLAGGRGSGKSSFCALEMILGIMQDKTGLANGIVIRKWAVTLRGSVFSQLKWAVDILGVSDYWRSSLTPMQFTYLPTGAVIRLSGLDDPVKLKSLKPMRGFFKYLWIEEFSEIAGEVELRNLQQSVLRGGDSFVVLRSWNPPISRANWSNQLFNRPDERSMSLLTTYLQMPPEWLGSTFVQEAEQLKSINPKAYEHEFLGLPVGQGAEVFSENLEIRTISDEEADQCDKIHSGLDWGFSQDPACFLRVNYEPKTETIMILDEIYKTHMSNAQLAEEIKSRGWDKTGGGYIDLLLDGVVEEKALIIADSAEPKSINDMRSMDLKVIPCRKFAGCIEYRLRWLQHRKIIVDPARTPNAARELQNYCYDVDKRTGEILSSVPDRDNHAIDSLSYSLDRQIYSKKYPA